MRKGIHVARCTVERLMKGLGIQGIRRGKKYWTTIADDLLDRPTDKVNRQFVATRPNQLWVADITFVTTWTGFVYVAVIIDVFARFIVGWRISLSLRTELVLDALEHALWTRQDVKGLIHHSERGGQYLSIRYTERLIEVNLKLLWVASVTHMIMQWLKRLTVYIKQKSFDVAAYGATLMNVEFATLDWVDWFNNRRLLEPIGNIPPVEFEKAYYCQMRESADAA